MRRISTLGKAQHDDQAQYLVVPKQESSRSKLAELLSSLEKDTEVQIIRVVGTRDAPRRAVILTSRERVQRLRAERENEFHIEPDSPLELS